MWKRLRKLLLMIFFHEELGWLKETTREQKYWPEIKLIIEKGFSRCRETEQQSLISRSGQNRFKLLSKIATFNTYKKLCSY